MNTSLKIFSTISLTAFLSACGGGGGSNSDSSSSGSNNSGTTTGTTIGKIEGGEGNVIENTSISTSGKLIDSANGNQSFEKANLKGTYGNLTISENGSWTYTLDSALADPLNANEKVTDAFTVGVGVGGGSETTKVNIQITGYDDPYSFSPSLPLSTLVVNNKERASGNLVLEDVDGNTPKFVAGTINGEYGEFTLSTDGSWLYSLNNNATNLKAGETREDTIKFKLSDNTEHSVNFSIATVNSKENSIVFVFMNFSDALATREAGVSEIADMTFNKADSLDKVYLQNSQGQLKFQRHRIEKKSLSHYCYGQDGVEESSIDCITYNIPDSQNGGTLSIASVLARKSQGGEYTDGGFTWRDKAQQWAKDNLVDDNGKPLNLRDWDHQVYIYPSEAEDANLIGAGIASVGEDWSFGAWSIVAARTDQALMGHELGHNIGLGHAGLDENNDGRPEDEYGTAGSFMGNWPKSRLFGSPHREVMGWYKLFPDYSTTINQVAGSSQDIEIQAIELTAGELTGTLPQQLKVQSNGSKNGQAYYYVNYHVAHNTLNPRAYYDNSVSIHYLNDIDSSYVKILEKVGDSFKDTSAGLTITYKSNNTSNKSAVVSVSYNN
ncbi:VCBS domain-containing protein [Microbulbifer sp. DLAB2-AF]|uniref:VCBS domain-containing protein n=1 Tax=Microbulbifer sp. DLAB2-AF TaxID=3243395 RepID=UPI004038FE75